MHGIIEDLEALTELNDELEESHLETEKQMQEELGAFSLLCAFRLRY
jgi:dynactin 1